MQHVIDFFKNLPAKMCNQCGTEMSEQADCYGNVCTECDHPAR